MKNLLKNILIVLIICLTTMLSISFATTINGMTEEEIRIKYEEIKKERQRLKNARNSKFEIIRNNNVEIEKLKQQALNEISKASKKVDNLMYQIKNNQTDFPKRILYFHYYYKTVQNLLAYERNNMSEWNLRNLFHIYYSSCISTG